MVNEVLLSPGRYDQERYTRTVTAAALSMQIGVDPGQSLLSSPQAPLSVRASATVLDWLTTGPC